MEIKAKTTSLVDINIHDLDGNTMGIKSLPDDKITSNGGSSLVQMLYKTNGGFDNSFKENVYCRIQSAGY